MSKAVGCLIKGVVIALITVVGGFFMLTSITARNTRNETEIGIAASAHRAAVTSNVAIERDSTARFDESFTIDTAATTKGNGNRWIFTPEGVSISVTGIDDTTGGITQTIPDYSATQSGEELRLSWKFPPNSGVRTFVLHYVVTGAVRTYSGGGSVFNWTFFDKSNSLPMVNFSASVTFPSDSKIGPIAFGHTGQRIEEVTPTGSTINWAAGPTRSATVVELLAEFESPSLAAGAPRAYPGTANDYASGKKVEESYVPPPKEPPRPPSRLIVLLPLALGPALIGLILLFQRLFGREYKVANAPIYERELPSNETPAEVGWLKRFGQPDVNDVTATIIDLAHRGFLRIHDTATYGTADVVLVATPQRASGQPQPHEAETLAWLFPDPGGVTYMSGLNAAVKANPSLWQTFWSRFQAGVKSLVESKAFIETKSGGAVQILIRVLGIIVIILSVIIGSATSFTWALVTLAGAVISVFAGSIDRRSRMGAEVWARWDAFRRYLHDFSTLSDVPPAGVVLWEEYLAYAVPLDEADTVLKYMALRPPVEGENDWYPANPAFLGIMTAQMASTMSAGTPSSSSGGGGFSGGGGGGFGGGGGASFD